MREGGEAVEEEAELRGGKVSGRQSGQREGRWGWPN